MIRQYRRFSASDEYIIGFIYKKELYSIQLKEIMPRFTKVGYTSSQRGRKQILRLSLTNKYMEQLIRKGAEKLGDKELIEGTGNKGVAFENLIYEQNGLEPRPKDNIPFFKQGDITLEGKEIQIKMNGATICMESTLKNLQKKARLSKKALQT